MNDKDLAKNKNKKKITPMFETSVTNGYKGVGIYGNNTFAKAYTRLGVPDFDEELGIEEVDSNPLS